MRALIIVIILLGTVLLYLLNDFYFVKPAERYLTTLGDYEFVIGCQDDIWNKSTGELIRRGYFNCLPLAPNPFNPNNAIIRTAEEQVRVSYFGYRIIELILLPFWVMVFWPIWIWVVLFFIWLYERSAGTFKGSLKR